MDKGDWPEDPISDIEETIYRLDSSYKIIDNVVIQAEQSANDAHYQSSYVERGLIKVNISFKLEDFDKSHLTWAFPLELLGFKTTGQYKTPEDAKQRQVNNQDGDFIYYDYIDRKANIMLIEDDEKWSHSALDRKARGIHAFKAATSHPINISSKFYDAKNKEIRDFTQQKTSEEFQETVMEYFFYRARPDETGEDLKNLVYQIRDYTRNRFEIIEIYEKIDTTGNTKNYKSIFNGSKITRLVKSQYVVNAFKPAESVALVSFNPRGLEKEINHLMVLPLLLLCE